MERHSITIDGNKIRYLQYGNAKDTLVLIHGLGASADRWEFVIPHFEKHFTVIVPDLIGFGFSDKPLTDYTPEFFSKFLAMFLKELHISNPYLIGSSLGGQICAEYTSSYNSVKKLVLVSPSGIMKHSTPALDAYVMAALYPNEIGTKHAFEMMSGSAKAVDKKIIDGFIYRMKLPNAKQAFMSTLLGLKNSQLITAKLKTINAPTLIVWGANDSVIPIKYADDFVSSIKDCRFFRFDGAGHTPYVERPLEFAKVVMDFLT